jgi:uridylate kinase
MQKEPIIISVGGSLIIQETVNTSFIEKLVFFLERHISSGERFILVTGGGKTARLYQNGLKHFYPKNKEGGDWLGIDATKMNAKLFQYILSEYAHPEIIGDPKVRADWTTPILIGAGYEPGHSTDYDAVCLASTYEAKKIINLSNIDYAYDSDPRINKDAKIITEIDWLKFIQILPEKWDPGLSSPFDPIASRLAHENNLEVSIINGEHLDRLEDYMAGKNFIGTIIRN